MSVTSRVARRGIKPCPIETSGRLNWVTARESKREREKERELDAKRCQSRVECGTAVVVFVVARRAKLSSELGW